MASLYLVSTGRPHQASASSWAERSRPESCRNICSNLLSDLRMNPRILLIGTHHKTGTVWFSKVFRALSREFGIPFRNLHYGKTDDLDWIPSNGRVFIANWSSLFSVELLDRQDVHIVHLIRDPRDVLLSGLSYHMRVGKDREKFLHRERPELDGRSYQEHLHFLTDDESRLFFEMEMKHKKTLRQMRKWQYGRGNATEWRYENLIADTDCEAFRRLMKRMGFDGTDLDRACEIFWENSLFGGLASLPKDRSSVHVVSGAPYQWKTKLPKSVAQVYADKFNKDLIALGYESDLSWLDELERSN